ncbi:ubiquitin-conjugating enzyme E2 J1-like [Ornithodoros turicata]|uniref:Putative ubiquitin protein ligase n=1 Tax=Ornithodoros turicata TaxID=34597 RepID=A0A2R5LN29_9ACAR
MEGQYNLRSPAVKRIMREAQELREPTEEYFAQPLEDNLFEWHFTVRGPPETEFEGGLYHGRVILPPEYPMKPPSIILLTPNGRFETNKKICLSISGHHPESWQPSWSLRTALLAIIGFMPTHGSGAIGSLDYTPEERRALASKSQKWSCPRCGPLTQLLKEGKGEAPSSADQEARQQAAQITFKGAADKGSLETLPPTENAASAATPSPDTQLQASSRASLNEEAPSTRDVTRPGNDTQSQESLRRRAAEILARRAERLQQQHPVTGPPRVASRGHWRDSQLLKTAWDSAIWLVGMALVGLVVRRVFFV